MQQTKQFHLSDVLSITTNILVSPRGSSGFHGILGFMTGDILFPRATVCVPLAFNKCRPLLIMQFPKLDTDKMKSSITELRESLNRRGSDMEAEKIVADWLAKRVTEYGEMLTVTNIRTMLKR